MNKLYNNPLKYFLCYLIFFFMSTAIYKYKNLIINKFNKKIYTN